VGRWHNADLSGGFSLIETDSPEAAYEFNAEWSDVLDLHMYPVIEDAEAGTTLANDTGNSTNVVASTETPPQSAAR
jgi:Protein of unknown function (DUF3303)